MTEEKKDFSAKRNTSASRKARPMLIDSIIDRAREDVIRADLELSFVKEVKAKFSPETPFLSLAGDEKELQMIYDYYLQRLTYFKNLRDRIRDKEEQKRLAQEVLKTTPETVTVTTHK